MLLAFFIYGCSTHEEMDISDTLSFQINIGEELVGQSLLDYLAENYKTATTLGYDKARDTLYGIIDLTENNQLTCIYSGYTITLDLEGDPSTDAYNKGINCEHVFPQSMGAEEEPQKSDLHHLFPCKDNVNSSRSNHPYREIPDEETDTWYRQESSLTSIPTEYLNEYAEKDNGIDSFEPRELMKGNVARASFYFYAMYESEANTEFFDIQKEVLLNWHYSDPVDELEYNRTLAIALYQENHPNPFIQDSTLVRRAWFSD